MEGNGLIWMLALATLVIVVAVAIWQRKKVSDSKDKKSHSAMTEGRPEQRTTDGAPGVKPR